ncbi:ribose-5-phosphate isomerase A [Sphingomonas trueperi]|uniref:ribose-5-phosphate isomerase A n=1 Tax=Sphingomonas trueperi TaxID=53317 RepID=UPI0033949412
MFDGAAASRRMIAVVDSSKPAQYLDRAKVPVEVLPFARCAVEHRLRELDAPVAARRMLNGDLFVTDQKAMV